MSALEEAKAVWDAFQTYKECRRELEQKQKQQPIKKPKKEQIILDFFFPTPDFHPNPKAKETLEGIGFVHRVGDFGVGYYADNVK